MNDVYMRQFQHSLKSYKRTRMQKMLTLTARLVCREILRTISERLSIAIRVKRKTFWDGDMLLVFPDRVSSAIFTYGLFEEAVTRILLEYLQPGMTFFDIGAHFGYFTLLASEIVGNDGQVHSFEPTQRTFEVLQTNVRNKGNVRPNRMAAWSKESTITFNDYGLEFAAWNSVHETWLEEATGSQSAVTTYQVEAISLDRYISDTGVVPSFVKLDAEGAEYEILQGMDKALAECRPIVTIEVGDRGLTGVAGCRDAIRHVLERGYQAIEYREGTLVRHQLRDRYSDNNILLLPSELFSDRLATAASVHTQGG